MTQLWCGRAVDVPSPRLWSARVRLTVLTRAPDSGEASCVSVCEKQRGEDGLVVHTLLMYSIFRSAKKCKVGIGLI